MHEAQMGSALHHFGSGHPGIEAARKQAYQLSGGLGGAASGTGDAPRVNKQWSARHFDAASALRRFEIDTDMASFRMEPVEKIPADLALDGQCIQRKAFVASPGAHGKAGEGFAADFFPGGCAEGVERASVEIGATQDASDAQMGDSADARQPTQGLFDLRGVRKLDDQSIGGLRESCNGNSLQPAAPRLPEFVPEKTAVSAPPPPPLVVT